MELYAIVLAVLFSTTLCSSPRKSHQYRDDYEYNSRTNAFYKFHIETRRQYQAMQVCTTEGAKLMVTENQEDLVQLHGMFKKFPNLGENMAWVAADGNTHESAEEQAIINLNQEEDYTQYSYVGCDVVTRSNLIEAYPCYRQLPFICKVEVNDAPYDPQCGVYGLSYQYEASVGSCYKIPSVPLSWNEAYAECRAEGAHLVILNSEMERTVVQNLMHKSKEVTGAKTSWFFFAGFRANKPAANETPVFKTIFNQTLQDAGFATWSPNEPNNSQGTEYCGTLFKNDGLLNDVDCSHEFGFICEKEVHV